MTRGIDGTTRLAGLIGWPIDHTLSPAMHAAAYERMALNWVYLPLAVRDGAGLPKVVTATRSLPFVGFNVTMPYKRLMLNLCDEVATQARIAGSVNTVHIKDGTLIGYNTDGRGLLESLRSEAGLAPEGTRVVILGAGGAAGAALVAFVLARAAHVTVAARRAEQAEDVVDRVLDHARETELLACGFGMELKGLVEAADVVVNATPVGMAPGDGTPVPPEWIQPGCVVADMIYNPAVTPLMAAAAERGATVVGGLGMLVAQGAIAIEIWNEHTQAEAPRDVMRAAAAEALSALPPRVERGGA